MDFCCCCCCRSRRWLHSIRDTYIKCFLVPCREPSALCMLQKRKKNNILKLNRIYLNCAFERDKHFFMNWSVIAIDSSMNKFSNACHSHFLHGHNQCIPKKCKTWSDNQMHTISLYYGHFQTYGEKKNLNIPNITECDAFSIKYFWCNCKRTIFYIICIYVLHQWSVFHHISQIYGLRDF